MTGSEPQRAGHAAGLGEVHDAAVVGVGVEVDEVVRPVARGPRHPQGVDVGEDLLRGDTEVPRELVHGDGARGLEEGDQTDEAHEAFCRPLSHGAILRSVR